MNKVFLIGNLTRDPELTETANGVSVCRFGIAVNRRGNGAEQTDFYNVTAFRALAETISRYKKKGDKVAIVGDIQIRNYEANDGTRKTSVDVVAQDIEFIGSKNAGGEDFYEGSPAPEKSAPKKKPALQSFDDDGDIPF